MVTYKTKLPNRKLCTDIKKAFFYLKKDRKMLYKNLIINTLQSLNFLPLAFYAFDSKAFF